ncbi:TPA: nucleotidyl transferase AbiEii/AbiGii toxin family protein [Legionella pneumophila subsp. pneumophila]|uniref:Nucleotidyl transferase AbiEii/AbiGii toxin family protein n=1 Tax=Legionella taurinensis TaxID=70611 RepID=A0A3A5LCF3_9GAMM|nr:nucleotidyl transferase AbiEii/AbiGii toxin family protein [Legionella taurinensis]RJT44439.1 nucleotidyl transferase AbiEii/AbiGii toxin family protein [Legionella taurinensis]HAT9712911.1 nucleotidyl transferase AbiEii/AbiGii toxin family protein [Legionella pneumophila subsp. pneumophila]HAT9921385.1 nucleotidyl transferase AbiEii/AbiGii toxin family protein [Legionella pneumophila subsp. pneumophila]
MPGELNEQQIRQTAILLGLPSEFIRKDYFVTKAIRLLVDIQNDYFGLVFQGGTSLSKGYGIISRLSEDIDFRVVSKPACSSLGKDAKRRELRSYRHALVGALVDADFDVKPHDVQVFYEGRYMSIRASFDGSQGISYLRPHIAIDCFLGTLELNPEIKNISSMVKVTLGNTESNHDYFPVACVNLNETAAEKWVALSRRIVDANKTPRDSDKHLVRHLYDLYQLQQKECLSNDYYQVVERVLEKEQDQFGSSTDDLRAKIGAAFHHLRFDKKWEEHWDFFLEQMVYQSEKPRFEEAVSVVENMHPNSLGTFNQQSQLEEKPDLTYEELLSNQIQEHQRTTTAIENKVKQERIPKKKSIKR